jgi:hypothetical protein
MPWLRNRPSLAPWQNLFSLLLPFPTRGEVAGWGRISFYCAPHFSPAHPSAPRRALYPSEHILIVRDRRAKKLAARLALTATPTRHTPFQANTALPHRHTEDLDRAAYRRRPLSQ